MALASHCSPDCRCKISARQRESAREGERTRSVSQSVCGGERDRTVETKRQRDSKREPLQMQVIALVDQDMEAGGRRVSDARVSSNTCLEM